MNKAKITIVIPVKDRAGIVGATLDSVRKQRLRPLDVIVVDNNSTDDTLALLNEWKEHCEGPELRITVLSEPTPGAAAARNRGLAEVTTPYTMFFDSDDLMTPNHVRRAVDALDRGYDIVGWDVMIHGPKQKKARHRFYDKNPLWHNLMHASLATLRYAARTELFRSVGAWNPDDHGWDDIELGTRLLLTSPRLYKIKGDITVNVIYRVNSITGEAFSPGAERWEKSLDLIEASLRQASRPVEAVDLRRAHLAGLYAAEGSTEDAVRLMRRVKERYHGAKRLAMLFAFRYTALGGRGLGRFMAPFIKL
ncbi:MAG: glycosyltransferase family 2 protein [Muribaculaceae bacterium]|nr:glycosyltransferase family 2 protein [Muribaculaceae bacterium]